MGTKREVNNHTARTRTLEISDERWNQLFGLPEGTKTKTKVIKMSPRLQKMAYEVNHLVDKDGNKVTVSREHVDELLALESRNGELFVGFVVIDSGQLIIADPAYLRAWKSFESKDPSNPFDHEDGDYERVSDLVSTDSVVQVPEPVLHGFAVASSTNGDGAKPVFATFRDGRVTSLRIELEI
jgi:hypothetical protein